MKAFSFSCCLGIWCGSPQLQIPNRNPLLSLESSLLEKYLRLFVLGQHQNDEDICKALHQRHLAKSKKSLQREASMHVA